MSMKFLNIAPVDKDLLGRCRLNKPDLPNGGRFAMLSPFRATISSDEADGLIAYLEAVTEKAGFHEVPQIVRIDTVPTDQGLKVIEVNADIPGGMGYIIAALEAYGFPEEADRFMMALLEVWGEEPHFLCDSTWPAHQSIISMEIPLYQRHVPHLMSTDIQTAGLRLRDVPYFRACGKAAFDSSTYNFSGVDMKNALGSWSVGDKTLLAKTAGPLAIEAEVRTFAVGDTVPAGVVVKDEFGLGGDGVYFPGQSVAVAGRYLVQEFVEFPTHDFDGTEKRYGLDVYIVGGKHLFALSRTARLDEDCLNVSQGGDMIPGILTVE